MLGIVSPGPDFIVVSHSALAGHTRSAVYVASGVVIGNALWAATGLLGLRVVFAVFPAAFVIFKMAGAVYLGWLGAKVIRGAGHPRDTSVERAAVSAPASFRKGLLTPVANPKAAVFYASVLTSVTPASPSSAVIAGVLAGVLFVAGAWYATVIALLGTPAAGAAYRRAKAPIERTLGALLLGYSGTRIVSELTLSGVDAA
jgi:threonine efflux protein